MVPIECGEDAAKHFAFEEGYRNLDHGSYGTYPIEIRDVFRDFQSKTEAQPDVFIRYEYRIHLLDESCEAIARYLKASTETCVYVPNATTGIETVLRNLVYQPGDVIVLFSSVYPAFANTAHHLSQTTPVQVKIVGHTLPPSDQCDSFEQTARALKAGSTQSLSDQSLCDAFEKTVKDLKAAGQNPRVAIFDTINTLPGIRMPFERLVQHCKTHNILSCLDGAHGVGHIPLDLPALDPDFFVSNCHKWLYVPRSCAIFYVPERNQHLLRTTLPTSFQYGNSLVSNFSSVGTLDDNPYLCVPAALEWRKSLSWGEKRGEEAAMGYMRLLAREGGQKVAEIPKTEVLGNEEGTLGNCNFANVRLPLDLSEIAGGDTAAATKMGEWLMQVVILEYQTALYTTFFNGSLWARLSSQVYLTLADFEATGHSLLEVCARARQGKWKQK